MRTYWALLLVIFIGLVAIGSTAYSLNSFIQEASTPNLLATPAWHTQKIQQIQKNSSSTFSYIPLAPEAELASARYYSRKFTTKFSQQKNIPRTATTSNALPPVATTTKPSTTPAPIPSTTPATTTLPKPSTTTPTPVPQPTSTPTSAPTPAPAPVPTPAPTPAATSAPANTPPPASVSSMQWGVFAGDSNDNLSVVEGLVGKKANIQAIFLSFRDDFPTYIKGLCPDRSLLIFWENTGISYDTINSGQYDAYFKKFSDGAAKYGCPVILSPFHEMNGNWDTWGGTVGNNSATKLIAAWRRMHDLMPASNIRWAWAVNNDSVPDTPENQADRYYPGEQYVDYVGVDGFNFNDPWRSFASVFDVSIANLQKYNKPIYIFSMGSVANSKKAAWITEGLGAHLYTYKNVRGWVWFNQNGGDGNWSVNSDPASLEAFKAVIPQ